MIEFKNVKLNIRNIDILSDINFVIKDNSAVCFLGNKNSGKTSVLKILSGIHKKYSGEVFVDGVILEDSKCKISMIFDKPEENTGYNVYEYLKFYGRLYNLDDVAIDKYIDEMLKKFLIISYKYTNLELLDIDTMKLVQIIRALIFDPDVILFDNIFIDDNYEYNEMVLNFFKKLKGKKTLIFVSRNLNYLESICDDIGILERGRLIEFGNIHEVYKKAELNKKVEVELYDGMQEAIDILNNETNVSNLIYEGHKIVFSLDGDREEENVILKKLTDSNIKVYSFRKENVNFEQLFGKFVEK